MEEFDDSLIKKIKTLDLKKLSDKELSLLGEEIRNYIIRACSINGGHLASNLGVVELTIALHKAFELPKDKLIFDVGHQSYTHKILTGRSLRYLRKENGIGGFQKRAESIYDPFDAGHSSTSISAAMGMALERDLKGEHYDVIAVIGDASIANGLSFEALNNISNFPHKIIIVINDNNMSISNSTGGLHNFLQRIRYSRKYSKMKSKTLKRLSKTKFSRWLLNILRKIKNFFKKVVLRNNIFELFGLYYIGNVDGHDFHELQKAFKKAKKASSSVVIHVSTIKGKGYEFAENGNVSSWHSVRPFDIKTGKSLVQCADDLICWSEIYARLLNEEMKNNKSAILINPATMVGSKITKIYENNKERTFDVGISEEHALTFASGYSAFGRHAYVSIYSSFMQRAYDEINHDVARLNLPVTILVDRAGFVGEDGETHQGIFDEAFLINMPNVAVAMAKDYSEAKALFKFASNYQHPLAIRYPLGVIKKEIYNHSEIKYGKWVKEKEPNDSHIAIITFGEKVNQLLKCDLNITIVNAIFQSPIDEETIKSLLKYDHIVIYDAYAIEEGFCYHVLAKLNEYNYKNDVKIFAIKNTFIPMASIEHQEKENHVDIDTIISYLKSIN